MILFFFYRLLQYQALFYILCQLATQNNAMLVGLFHT